MSAGDLSPTKPGVEEQPVEKTHNLMTSNFAEAQQLWKKTQLVWNGVARCDRALVEHRNRVTTELMDVLKKVSYASRFATEINDVGMLQNCAIARAVVLVFRVKMLGLQQIVRRPLSELQESVDKMSVCRECLRPFINRSKNSPCTFCNIVKDSVDKMPLTDDPLVIKILFSARRLDLLVKVVSEEAFRSLVDRVLVHARVLCTRVTKCCDSWISDDNVRTISWEQLRQWLPHTSHVEARTFLETVALMCLRKVVEAGVVLSDDDSLLYDQMIGTQQGRPVCALCRVNTSLIKSHIISRALLELGGKYGPKLQPCVAGVYGKYDVVKVEGHTESLCCKLCELIFSRFGETHFCQQFRGFVDSINRNIPQTESLECASNECGISSLFHTIVGIACRSLVSWGTEVSPKQGADLRKLKKSTSRLRELLRSVMLASDNKDLFCEHADKLIVMFVPSSRALSDTPQRPMFVFNNAYGGEVGAALVHLCLHGLHFFVMCREDGVKLQRTVLGTWQEIGIKTGTTAEPFTVDLSSVARCPWIVNHDIDIFDDLMKGFALSMRRDRIEAHLPPGHSALQCIPDSSGSIMSLQCALVRLPPSMRLTLVPYRQPQFVHHPGKLSVTGKNSGVCHVHRTYFGVDVDNVNVHLCVDNGTLVAVIDVDMTKLLKREENVSHLRPRLVFAVGVSNGRVSDDGEVEWDIVPYKDDHEDMFKWDDGLFASLGTELPKAVVTCMFKFYAFRARLHQQKFTSVDYTLRPLPPEVEKAFKVGDRCLYEPADLRYMGNTKAGSEALKLEMELVLSCSCNAT
jgi:hypothetical protein